jgi:hypothetical protein
MHISGKTTQCLKSMPQSAVQLVHLCQPSNKAVRIISRDYALRRQKRISIGVTETTFFAHDFVDADVCDSQLSITHIP